MGTRNIHRADFPPGPHQVQGMAAQANTWLLIQIDEQDMSAYEALFIASAMLDTVVRLIGREEAQTEKRRRAQRKKKDIHDAS